MKYVSKLKFGLSKNFGIMLKIARRCIKCHCHELSKALRSRDYCMKPEHYFSLLAAFSLSLLFADLRVIDGPFEPFFFFLFGFRV